MALNDQTVKVTLVAVAQPYTRGINEAANSTRKLGTEIDKTGNQSKGFATKTGAATAALKGMAAAGAAVAGTALVAFLRGSVEAASDLNETVGKVGEVLGQDVLPGLREWGQTAAQEFGQSERAALDAAATFGVFGKSAGLAGQDLVGFSTELTELASDLASFGNTTPEDAVQALGAALRGESEPIRRYGVLLDDATLRQRAMAEGITDTTTKALTPQQRVLAAHAEILAQTSDAQGDFARTSDNLANQQRILAAEWENARAELGEKLLPAMTEFVGLLIRGVDFLSAFAQAFSQVPAPVWAAAAALVAVHVAGGPIGKMALTVRTTMRDAALALDYAGQAAARAGGGFAGAAAGLRTFTGQASLAAGAARGLAGLGKGALALVGGPWGAAFLAAAAVTAKFMGAQQEARQRVEELTDSLDAQTGEITENTRAIVAKRLADEGLLEIASRLGIEQGVLTDALLGSETAQLQVNRTIERAIELGNEHRGSMNDSLGIYASNKKGAEDLRDAMGGLGTELGTAQDEWDTLNGEIQGGEVALESSTDAALNAGDAQRTLADMTKEAADAAAEAKRELDEYIDSLTAAGLLTLDSRSATREFAASLDEMAEAFKESREAGISQADMFDINTEAGRANQAALDDAARSAIDLADAIYEETGSEAEFRASLAASREALVDTAEEFGMSRTEAEEFADSILAIPDSHRTVITVDKAGASSSVYQIQREINGIQGKTVYVNVVARTIGTPGALSSSTRGGLTLASGGAVRGPGTPTSDSIPAWLSNGEYVVKAAAVAKYGMNFMHDLNAMRLASGGPVGGSLSSMSGGIDYGRLAAALMSRPTSEDNSVHFHGDMTLTDMRAAIRQGEDYKRMRRST